MERGFQLSTLTSTISSRGDSSTSAESSYHSPRDLVWSRAEKRLARQVFDRALQADFVRVISEVKKRAAKIEQPSQLWELERYIAASGKRINREYDWRASVLIEVFANLILKGRIQEQELEGLREDKLNFIRRYVQFAREQRDL